MTCDKICKPKYKDSLGIRCTEDLNSTFLTKQDWKVLTQLDNIRVRIVNVKYLNNNGNSVSFWYDIWLTSILL